MVDAQNDAIGTPSPIRTMSRVSPPAITAETNATPKVAPPLM